MAKTDNNQKIAVSAEVPISVKEAYKRWWQEKGFASEADALRWHIRKVTNFDPESQEKSAAEN